MSVNCISSRRESSKLKNKIELKDANLWPTGIHKWEISICKRKVLKELPPIVEGQVFGLHEMISKNKMNSKVVCESEEAHLLTINSTDLFTILSEQEIFGFLNFECCIKFPEDVSVLSTLSFIY